MCVCLQELHFHVEECLSRNLHVRCSGFVQNVLSTCVQRMNGNDCLQPWLIVTSMPCFAAALIVALAARQVPHYLQDHNADAPHSTRSMSVRHISPTWLHSTRQTLNDISSGRRKPELQSWNGHGPNSANAHSQFAVPMYGTVFLQQSAALTVMQHSEISEFTFILLCFYCITFTRSVVMHSH